MTDTHICVYDGRSATTVRTGKLGNRFGLCAECAPGHDSSVAVDEQIEVVRALADIESAKTSVSPAVAECLDYIAELVVEHGDPAAVFDSVVALIAREKAERAVKP
ncbi:hypothetical protein [Streptomyces sp. NPDC058045]|uniref:hypothetical protein n=1 Tax=Streptomyces sp. NPDC058045 TaxID=3346311 RepID=UPI0036EFBFEC